jgi:hypothetical protein
MVRGGWDNQITHPGLFTIEPSDAMMDDDRDYVPTQASQHNPEHDGSAHAPHDRETNRHIRREKCLYKN